MNLYLATTVFEVLLLITDCKPQHVLTSKKHLCCVFVCGNALDHPFSLSCKYMFV